MFVLRKKELKEKYWPRLLKESKKMHFLKTDFDKVGFLLIWCDQESGLKDKVLTMCAC